MRRIPSAPTLHLAGCLSMTHGHHWNARCNMDIRHLIFNLVRRYSSIWQRHSDLAAAFAEGMTCTTRRIERALLGASPFGPFDLVIDVGGSFGSLLRLLLAQRPLARGIVFDRPEIADAAARRWAHDPDADRLQAVGGSFLTACLRAATCIS